MDKPEQESEKYQSMLTEVEEIIRSVGSESLDLDEIVGKVEKGYGLIKTMRARLDETKLKVETLRQEYDSPTPE